MLALDEEEVASLVEETRGATKRNKAESTLDVIAGRKTNTSGAVPTGSCRAVMKSKLAVVLYLSLAAAGLILRAKDTVETIESKLIDGPHLPRTNETIESKLIDGPHLPRTNETVESKLADEPPSSDVSNFHTPLFGGENNLAHPGGAKAAALGQGVAFEDIEIPVSNLGHAVKSLSSENVVNHWGHYVHDEHRSPYASFLYDKPKEFLEAEQEKYVKKMEAVRKEWGAWNFKDDNPTRPRVKFSADYKDTKNADMPEGAWQTDEVYVTRLIGEARSLVNRVTEGIYAEYGSPLKRADGTILSEEEKKERDEKWKLHVLQEGEPVPKGGIGKLSQVAFDGLVRKLLHALVTNDEFYVVLAGHSAAAGHGNNFHQNKVMAFHKLMEPVFAKLGVRLISRNMAMGGVATFHVALSGADHYGEADVMEWDSSMTEKGNSVDFFVKQAILTGERVPVIIMPTNFHFNVIQETNGTAWMGNYASDGFNLGGETIIPPTIDAVQALTLPYAARWINEKMEKFNSVCWEPRSDATPPIAQAARAPGAASWHPGFRSHQWQGRKLSLIILRGLSEALDTWELEIKSDGFPLAESFWHVGDSYKIIREHLRTHINTPKPDAEDDVRSACEKCIPWLPRICRVAMHGFGMWRPRAHVDYDFLNIIHPAKNGYRPQYPQDHVYDGFDVLPYAQAVPDGEIDVHAIAIVTTYPPPDLDHNWIDNDRNGTTSGDVPTRRQLREASRMGFHRGMGIVESGKSDTKLKNRIQMADPNYNRNLADPQIVPGRGWVVHGWKPADELCDGSSMSTCGRVKSNNCLMYGANDNHLDVAGNSMSGWLVFTIPKVKEGIILARLECWCQPKIAMTKSWTEVDDGKTMDTTPYNATIGNGRRHLSPEPRRLKKKPSLDDLIPSDLEMDISINGVIRTMDREEFIKSTAEITKNAAIFNLLNDATMAQKDWKEGEEGEPVEVGIRFRSKINPQRGYCISHVYYA